jgi:antitoxin MazE
MKSNIRKIGNSKGVVIPPAFLLELNLDKDSDIEIELSKDGILIKPSTNPRESWEEMFVKAINNGDLPENDFSAGISNEFDETEWSW